MTHTAWPLVFLTGAVLALVLSAQFRLPEKWLPLSASWGLAAALWPAVAPQTRADGWDMAACMGASVLCAIATGHASRTRLAQLPPGWWTSIERAAQVNDKP